MVSAAKGCSAAGVHLEVSPMGTFSLEFPVSATGCGLTEIGFGLELIGFDLFESNIPAGFSLPGYLFSPWPSIGVVLTGIFLQPAPTLAITTATATRFRSFLS